MLSDLATTDVIVKFDKILPIRPLFRQYLDNNMIPVSDFFSVARAQIRLQNEIK